MSSYPVLDNKPIDQWKVTELKEELRRRKLKYSGKKDDLIKMLDKAIRIERENAEKEADNGVESDSDSDNEPVVEAKGGADGPVGTETAKDVDDVGDNNKEADTVEVQADISNSAASVGQEEVKKAETTGDANDSVTETAKDIDDVGDNNNKEADNVEVQADINNSPAVLGQEEMKKEETTGDANDSVTDINNSAAALSQEEVGKGETGDANDSVAALDHENTQEGNIIGDTDPAGVEEMVVHKTTVETSTTVTIVETSTAVTENVVSESGLNGQELQKSETHGDNMNSKPQLETEDSKPQLEDERLKPPHTDDMLDASATDNQVSEVSANLGSQVKSDSISTDSVSLNEKIVLKDNIIADNVKLELDVFKPEMVEPSSSNVVPVGGESHPMDVEEPHEKKTSVEEKDNNNATDADIVKKNDIADVVYSEKLNLDRSSGDDSMEEDVLESKQIDSKDCSDEVRDSSQKNQVPLVKEQSPVDMVVDKSSAEKKDVRVESKSRPVAPAEKRKFNDQEVVGHNEPLKRQRRWNSESLKLPEQQSSNITPTTTPRDTFQPALKRNFSRSDSTVSEDAPKERVVPPSAKAPTNSLRIDHFVRPFTLKAVQELLGKTGTFTSFWMDQIKTHCYITYSSAEEAIETRNALYNIQWPPNNGGRPLVAEFVDPQEVKMRTETPSQTPAAPVNTGPTAPPAPPTSQPQPSTRQPVPRQQLPPPPALPPPPPLTNPAQARERFPLPPPPPLTEKLDPPIVTLDDLFRKTKATPRIYYLPLSEEQVAAKHQARSKNTKQ